MQQVRLKRGASNKPELYKLPVGRQGQLHAASPPGAAVVEVQAGHTTPAHFRQQACLSLRLLLSLLSGTSFLLSFFLSFVLLLLPVSS